MLKCFESGQAVVKLRTLEAAVLTDISSQICIGVELILEDMLALRTEDALCIVVSQLSLAFLGIKSIVADRILQADRVKEGAVTIHQYSRFRHFSCSIQNHLVGRVDLTIAIHLVTENIGKDEEARFDIITNPR